MFLLYFLVLDTKKLLLILLFKREEKVFLQNVTEAANNIMSITAQQYKKIRD